MARSKEYDENAVLHKAMELFWEQGYEKTSMMDLLERMGIHRRSLYDTFIDKHNLFIKVLDCYEEMMDKTLTSGIKQCVNATQAMQFVFKYTIDKNEDIPMGCLFVNTAVELARRDADADTRAIRHFDKEVQLLSDIIQWGQENQEFSTEHNAIVLAESMHTTLLGLRVMVRTSISKINKNKLYRVATTAMNFMVK